MIKNNTFNLDKMREVVAASVKRDDDAEYVAGIKIYTIMFMSIVCVALTVMNIVKRYTVMSIATGIMAICLFIAVYLFKQGGKNKIGDWLIMLVIAVIFTFFAISGRNEGFAILWILLVPAVASNIFNLMLSLLISGYFQLLLVVIFYSPYREHLLTHYTATFCGRFPVLYLATFIVSYIIVVQKEYFSMQLDRMAHTDVLTGLANRREYDEILEKIDSNWDNYTDIRVFSMDLNGLKETNDSDGHNAGDELIRGAADCIRTAFSDALVVSRKGGDEFALVTDRPDEEIDVQMKHLLNNVSMWHGKLVPEMSIAVGSASKAEHPDLNIYELGNVADRTMYEDKKHHYETSGKDRRRSKI